MSPAEVVLQALERHDCNPRGELSRSVEARCPAHDDRSPSLSLKEGADGRALIHCHTGCPPALVIAELGLEWSDTFPREEPVAAPARMVATYDYVDELEQKLFQVIRYEPKNFKQRRWTGERYEWGLGDTRRVLYRLPKVIEALAAGQIVFVVEGEKDVHALESIGKVATTMPGGAGKWRDEYTASLAGAAHQVVVIGDDDKPGHLHVLDVWRRLTGKVGQVIARLPSEGYKDIAAQLSAGVPFTSSSLRRVPMLEATPQLPSADAGPLMLTARAMSARPAPERALRVVGPLIQRGMRTTIGAQTGEGKTTLGLEIISALVGNDSWLDEAWRPAVPGRALIVDLEQGEETVKTRLREAGLGDTDRVDVLWEPSGLALDSDPAHQTLLRDTLKAGKYDLVLLDPLYQMHRGNQNDERTAADVMRIVDEWSRQFGFALVIPMHARKPHPQAGKNFTMNDIAGSTTWNRNAEFVLGLQLMSHGFSRLWFFKDRIGQGPEVRTWWGLKYTREGGFERNFQEAKNALANVITMALADPAGVTRDELLERVKGFGELAERTVDKRLEKANVLGGRYREAAWHEQATLIDG